MKMAYLVASKSKDGSMKCGCVLVSRGNTVVSSGYNGFPRGVDESFRPERQLRPEKYFWYEHAERNSVYNAALNGVCTFQTTAYITAHPCVDCARALIQAGISKIYIPAKENDPFYKLGRWDDWAAQFEKADEILYAAGVMVHHAV